MTSRNKHIANSSCDTGHGLVTSHPVHVCSFADLTNTPIIIILLSKTSYH